MIKLLQKLSPFPNLIFISISVCLVYKSFPAGVVRKLVNISKIDLSSGNTRASQMLGIYAQQKIITSKFGFQNEFVQPQGF